MRFTVLGGAGFIGSALSDYLVRTGHEVGVPSHDATEAMDGRQLGHVIYAIGMTSDFRSRPFETVDAHVGVLCRLLKQCRFESWLYLSSTRVYAGLDPELLASEESHVEIVPSADSLYDLSKLLGEALCLAMPSDAVRVARLSNVFGPGQSSETFLGSVLRDAIQAGEVVIGESPDSSKDYIALQDVLPLLESIALRGTRRVYNVASGKPLTHAALAKAIAEITNAKVSFTPGARRRAFPRIDVSRVTAEFGGQPVALTQHLAELLEIAKPS